MQKGNWNKKSVYSIRKFSVGACSVLIGSCVLLLGSSLSLASSAYANENTNELISISKKDADSENKEESEQTSKVMVAEKSSEQTDNVPLKDNADATGVSDQTHADQSPVTVADNKEFPLEEGKTEVKSRIEETKVAEETNKAELQDPSVSKDKKEFKSAANEVVDKLIEDRNISFNQNWHFKLNANAKEAVKPDAVAKPKAKKSIDEALKAKNDEIESRTDLTDEEKIAAKADAKAKADAAKQAIDKATTNAAVEQAKVNGTTNVDSVNPTAEAKPAAKKAIDDALKAKNDEIDARTDLTDEEKTVAKEEAKAKADAA